MPPTVHRRSTLYVNQLGFSAELTGENLTKYIAEKLLKQQEKLFKNLEKKEVYPYRVDVIVRDDLGEINLNMKPWKYAWFTFKDAVQSNSERINYDYFR